MKNLLNLAESNCLLKSGGVLAYPTEAVFGLGCDPDSEQAVLTILKLKQRPIEKGLILIASHYSQLIPYIDESAITSEQKQRALTSWEQGNAVSWIFPKNTQTPYFLTGKFNSIAIRVTTHPLIRELCDRFGKPIVSTSANLSGQTPCKTVNEVETQFKTVFEDNLLKFAILQGETSGRDKPSEIRDIKTGQILRQG